MWLKMIAVMLRAKLQHVLTKEGEDEESDDEDEAAEDGDDNDDVIAGGLMNCLIQFKHHPMMDEKCRSGIEHHQLVSELRDMFISV